MVGRIQENCAKENLNILLDAFTITTSHDREIEATTDYHTKRKQGQKVTAMFIVHRKGQSRKETTWERYEDLWKFKDKTRKFIQQQCVAVVTTSGGGECDDPPCHHAT